jgi:hypothetical protein|tara:strand:+ start:1709 stop:2107 length:399 start_codon:yes stop_codon:yes gene_type:complete
MKSLIRNSNQTKQGIDFTGIENGKIHPTDIDAVLEFDNEALILIEAKKINNDLPTGQRLVLERICNSWHTPKSIVLFVTHNFKNDTKDIPLMQCNVEKFYCNNKWQPIENKPNLKNVLNKLGERWNIKKLKI